MLCFGMRCNVCNVSNVCIGMEWYVYNGMYAMYVMVCNGIEWYIMACNVM